MHPSCIKRACSLVSTQCTNCTDCKSFIFFRALSPFCLSAHPQIVLLYQVLNVIARKIINYFYSLYPQAMISCFLFAKPTASMDKFLFKLLTQIATLTTRWTWFLIVPIATLRTVTSLLLTAAGNHWCPAGKTAKLILERTFKALHCNHSHVFNLHQWEKNIFSPLLEACNWRV